MRFIVRSLLAAAAVCSVAPLPAAARVTRFELVSRTPIAYGYEKIVGRLWFADRPEDTANRRVVDLARAPRDTAGEVVSSDDIVILAPQDRTKSNGTALIDIPNRGGASALWFDRGHFARDGTADDLGSGFLMRHGFVTISVGWEFDVPQGHGLALRAPIASENGVPITGLVRSDFHVDAPAVEHEIGHNGQVPYPTADERAAANVLTVRDDVLAPRTTIPRTHWHFAPGGTAIALDGNFQPGHIYELVYRAKDPRIVGLGLAAVRDAASYFKYDASAPVHVSRAYGFGISQSGRFLRTFVQQGFNRDEQGRKVLDAMMPIVSGPSLGSFNFRFAQPSRDAAAFSSFFYPTDVPPFHESEWLPPDLDVIDIHTSHEYWGRTASLMTTNEEGTADVALPPNVRLYAVAGGMHVPGVEPVKLPGARARSSPLDWRPVARAALINLDAWVRTGKAPPPSRYPTIAAGTLVWPERWTFPTIPGLVAPSAVALHRTWRYDYGAGWQNGMIDNEPPHVGAPYATLVPKVDADGIDVGMLRLPEIAVPLATYTGWNLRDPTIDFGDRLVDFHGSFVPFAPTDAARAVSGDPRRSIQSRYGDRTGYLARYDEATASLVRDGYLLPEDAAALHARAEGLWALITPP